MTYTAETAIKQMEETNVFMKRDYTYEEYVAELMKFEALIASMVYGSDKNEKVRMTEIMLYLEKTAQEKGLEKNPAVRNGIRQLKKVEKELAISISGKAGENRVARALEFVEREHFASFRNVSLSDGNESTEIDNIVLTDNGILVLEVKNAKEDITISEDGRLLYNNSASYEARPMAEKLEIKRRLLRQRLESALKEKGVELPVHIDSFLVFATPRNLHINVTNLYRKEKYCFQSRLKYVVGDYFSNVTYSKEEYELLKDILGELDCCKKTFQVTLDFDEIRDGFAQAMEVLEGEWKADETEVKKVVSSKKERWNDVMMASAKACCLLKHMAGPVAAAVIPAVTIPIAMSLIHKA